MAVVAAGREDVGKTALMNWIKGKGVILMIVAMPVEKKSINSSISLSFGRTPLFLLFDTEARKVEFVENTAASKQGGAGIKAAQTIVDHKVNVLLTPRCGENAADVIKAAGIKIYHTQQCSAQENIDYYIDGKLSPLEGFHKGLHGTEGI